MKSYNSIIDRHKRRWGHNNNSVANDALEKGIEGFDKLIDEKLAPTVHDIKRTVPNEININNLIEDRMLVTDFSRLDNDEFDKKLFGFKLNSNVTTGCYVKWDDDWWILQNDENISFKTNKVFIAKRCNTIIKFGYDGNVYEYPVVLKNLTASNDGVSDLVNMSIINTMATMIIADNPITRNIKMDIRLMVNSSLVFKVSPVDNFTLANILKMNMKFDQFIDKDDIENNIAWNDISDHECSGNPFYEIKGEDIIYIGGTNEYYLNGATEWSITSEEDCLIIEPNGDTCKVTCKGDVKYINTTGVLKVKNIAIKKIYIRGLF